MSAKTRSQSIADHPRWEAVLGLEVHVQLNTKTKIFCRCPNRYGEPPNSLTCPTCVGLPGALPVLNAQAVEYAAMAGLALGCQVASRTKFDRKNYFYPDLPKGYQISQFDEPVCLGGSVRVVTGDRETTVRLTRIHMEEDAGKNIHVEGKPASRVDLNRAGVPLLEIVTEPDIRSPAEAAATMRKIRATMLYLGISDCNMEEGSLRCDCNISIRPRGSTELFTRTELKNLNSFSFVESACEYEISRQIQLREAGHEIVQETRLYDPDRNETRSMRGKEEAHDYRYFPEPDLAPVEIDPAHLEKLRQELPELPDQALERLQGELRLPDYDAEVLTQDPEVLRYFKACCEEIEQPKKISNWIINDVFQKMNETRAGIWEVGLPPVRLAEIIARVEENKVSVNNGREVLQHLYGSDEPVDAIIERLGVGMISDGGLIEDALREAMEEHPAVVEDIRNGKDAAKNFLMGQVMKRTRGKANPGQVMKLIGETIR